MFFLYFFVLFCTVYFCTISKNRVPYVQKSTSFLPIKICKACSIDIETAKKTKKKTVYILLTPKNSNFIQKE